MSSSNESTLSPPSGSPLFPPAQSPSSAAPRFPSASPSSAAPRFPSASPSSAATRFPSASPSSAAPRFLSNRIGGRSPALGSSTPAPSSDLRAPPVVTSPSKSADSFPRNALPPKDAPSPLPPGPARTPFSFPRNKLGGTPPSGGGRGSRGDGRQNKYHPSFNSSPRVRPDALRGKSPRAPFPTRVQNPFAGGPTGGGGAGGESPPVVGMRRRANTEPVSPIGWKAGGRGLANSKGDDTLGKPVKVLLYWIILRSWSCADLQSVLEGASMEKYITRFQEQEVQNHCSNHVVCKSLVGSRCLVYPLGRLELEHTIPLHVP